jgi:copper(I)-binding protein
MENGVSSMSPVKEVALEPGKTVEFKPGGFHVMLFDVADTLKAGGTTELTITLDNGDKATVVAKVTSPGGGEASGAMGGMEHMDHKM